MTLVHSAPAPAGAVTDIGALDVNDHQPDTLGSGNGIDLAPEHMDRLSAKFARDAVDFDATVSPVRQAMRNGGLRGWTSGMFSPMVLAIMNNHMAGTQGAEAFMGAVSEDLAIMGRNTRALKASLLGRDVDSANLLGGVDAAESASASGGETQSARGR